MPYDGRTKSKHKPDAETYAGRVDYDERARQWGVAKANAWYEVQSERLGMPKDEVKKLILKGWMPWQIEGTPATCLSDFARAPCVAAILAGRSIFDPY